MAQGMLKINGKDAYTEWGVSLTDGAMSALMTPPPLKALVENESRLQHGKRVIKDSDYVMMDERDISLPIHISAKDEDEFIRKYEKFCSEVLMKCYIDLWTPYQPNTIYRLLYISCRQCQVFMNGLAKFMLNCNEPNPDDRGLEPKED